MLLAFVGLECGESGVAWSREAGGDYDAGSVKSNTFVNATIFFYPLSDEKKQGAGDPVRFSKQDCAIIK